MNWHITKDQNGVAMGGLISIFGAYHDGPGKYMTGNKDHPVGEMPLRTC